MTDHEHQSDNHEDTAVNPELNWSELERTDVDSDIDSSATPPPNIPPPKKSKKTLIIILAIVGAVLILAGLTFFLYNQFVVSNLTSEEKIEKTTDQAELKKLYDELISSYLTSGKSEAEMLALLERAPPKPEIRAISPIRTAIWLKSPVSIWPRAPMRARRIWKSSKAVLTMRSIIPSMAASQIRPRPNIPRRFPWRLAKPPSRPWR